jgi:hypothetical protein
MPTNSKLHSCMDSTRHILRKWRSRLRRPLSTSKPCAPEGNTLPHPAVGRPSQSEQMPSAPGIAEVNMQDGDPSSLPDAPEARPSESPISMVLRNTFFTRDMLMTYYRQHDLPLTIHKLNRSRGGTSWLNKSSTMKLNWKP